MCVCTRGYEIYLCKIIDSRLEVGSMRESLLLKTYGI